MCFYVFLWVYNLPAFMLAGIWELFACSEWLCILTVVCFPKELEFLYV